ncbi:hypothetical protein SLS62_004681 [Diatrype stigma]|uniref:Uncharacterized protein n=1 Tax=Diatrype stigma TaxID=117547 RepID=A0AAN9UU08_9PEZI
MAHAELSDSEVDAMIKRKPQKTMSKATRGTTKEEAKHKNEERRLKQERNREASRPLPMFLYQVDQARRRILETQQALFQGPHEACFEEEEDFNTDINSKAYEIVKKAWIRRNIWTAEWTILPGLAWRHEQPYVDLMDESDMDNPIKIGRDNTDELRVEKGEREKEKKEKEKKEKEKREKEKKEKEKRRKENKRQKKTRVVEDYYLPDDRR